jgi:hypothetical protein
MLKKTFLVLLVLTVIVGVVLLAIPDGSNTSKRTFMREYIISEETDEIHTYVVSGPHEKDTPSFGTFQVATTVGYSSHKKYEPCDRYTPIKHEDISKYNCFDRHFDEKHECECKDFELNRECVYRKY